VPRALESISSFSWDSRARSSWHAKCSCGVAERIALSRMEEIMNTLNWRHRLMMLVALLSVPVLTGVPSIACGGAQVEGGGDPPGDCVVGGCSGQLCVEPGGNGASTCEWREEYACYKDHGICERGANNQCGWPATPALTDCIAAANNPSPSRNPVSGACIRNSSDACASDADCKTGGCGGELCEGAASQGVTDCNCTAPQGVSCGCVNGTCSWWQ